MKEQILSPIKFFFRDEIGLGIFTKNENESAQRLPPSNSLELSHDSFEKFLDDQQKERKLSIKQTKTVFIKLDSFEKSCLNEDDFEPIRLIGRGAYGKVMLAQKKDTKKFYAIKYLSKHEVIQNNHIEMIKLEKNIMTQIEHPFLVNLLFCFHTPSKIYFGMQYITGGNLYNHLKVRKTFSEEATKFYAAQVLLA